MQSKVGDGSVIVAGTVTRDADYRLVGPKNTPKTTFSVAVGKRQDTTTIFVNCVAWRGLARSLAGLQKGDSFFGVGKIESREYNGKTYTDLVLEFGISPAIAVKETTLTETPEQTAFCEVIDDDDLPF